MVALPNVRNERRHLSCFHSTWGVPCLRDWAWSPPNPPAYLDERLALVHRRVPNEVLVGQHFIPRAKHDDRAASILESAQALPSRDLRALLDAGVVFDAPDQHGTHRDKHDREVGWFAADEHDGAPVLAENIEGAGLVDRLWVDGVVGPWDFTDGHHGAVDG